MRKAVEEALRAMIYKPGFIKTDSGIKKLMSAETHSEW
jgi:hypothetical protein